jgi:hypothetical protein
MDVVDAARVDPVLPEAPLLRLGVLAAPLLYAREVALDWRRTIAHGRDLRLDGLRRPVALALFPLLRLVDLAGMVRALARGDLPNAQVGQAGE